MFQPKPFFKRLFLISFLYFFLVLASILAFFLKPSASYTEPRLVFCDVGQGDAILFLWRDKQFLIDAGSDNGRALDCLQKHMPWFDWRLELAILTHPDLDHMGGFVEIGQIYDIDLFVLPAIGKDSKPFREFRDHLVNEWLPQRRVGRVTTLPNETEITFSDKIKISFWQNYSAFLTGFDPFKNELDSKKLSALLKESDQFSIDINSLSIVTFLNIDQSLSIFTGDLDQMGELALIRARSLGEVAILKAGHHGAKTSSAEEFVSSIRPENTIISSGKNNSYGHPKPETLQILEKYYSRVWRTDELGDIIFVFRDGRWQNVNDH